jgi:hypothetical protein
LTDDPELQILKKMTWRKARGVNPDGKTGEVIGDGFVAYTGVPVFQFKDCPVRKLSYEESQWLKNTILPPSTNGHKAPVKSITSATRESGSHTEPSGTEMLPNYVATYRNSVNLIPDKFQDDVTQSGFAQRRISILLRGMKNLDLFHIVEELKQVERDYDAKFPSNRQNHTDLWRLNEVIKEIQNKFDNDIFVRTNNRETVAKDSTSGRLLEMSRHINGDDSELTGQARHIFKCIVELMEGLDTRRITNKQLAKRTGWSIDTIKRYKREIWDNHYCISISNNNVYSIDTSDKSCNSK